MRIAAFTIRLIGVVMSIPGASLALAQDHCRDTGDCAVAGGRYRIVLPEGPKPGERIGAILFYHGWQGTADETIADPGLRAAARDLRVAFVAPEGAGKTWSYPGSPGRHRDEFAFAKAVLADLARWPIDRAKSLATGFSQGGSMVWHRACRMPARFAAFAPIAGAFWEPLPERCAGPAPTLLHVHGLDDRTVPMEGRAVRSGQRQGDVRRSFARIAPGCGVEAAAPTIAEESLRCARVEGCAGARRIELCLHPGGHFADPAWIVRAWRQAQEIGAL